MLTEKLAKLNNVSQHSISTALVIIFTIALYGWIVSPHVTNLYAAQRYENVVDDVVKKNNIFNSAIKAKKKKLGKLSEQLTQLRTGIFTIEEAKEFCSSNLQVISEQSSCKISSLNLITNDRNSKNKLSEVSSEIVTKSAVLCFVGTYGNIVKFIDKLQLRPEKVWIDSFRMSRLEDNSGLLECEITITICNFQNKEAVPHE